MNENLNEMIKAKSETEIPATMIDTDMSSQPEPASTTDESEDIKAEEVISPTDKTVGLINFFDWYEANASRITTVARVQASVSNVNSKDAMIFKVHKTNVKETDESKMELITFYNPGVRPIPNLPPVYVKIYKNDTFEVLHIYNDEIFIKSYGVKTGLILTLCANVDGKVVPFSKIKVKKSGTDFKFSCDDGISARIKEKLTEIPNIEDILLLYKQAAKNTAEFTTKETTLDWFIKKQLEIVDINHLLKIDNVIMTTISKL